MSGTKYAAGLVVYRVVAQGVYQYLLVKASYPPYHWTPPKGHVDPGETDFLTTALRETEEEVGLTKNDLLVEDYKIVINYDVKGKKNMRDKPKEVTYWLAKLITSKEVKLSHEHTEFIWEKCDEAMKLVGFPTTGDVIKKCENFLLGKK